MFVCGGLIGLDANSPWSVAPFSFGRITLGRLPQPGEACLVEARFLRQVDRYADFDFTLFGVTGDVILM